MDPKNKTNELEDAKTSLTSINRLRGIVKTKCTRIKTFLENFVRPESDEEARAILETKLELIRDIKDSIKDIYVQYADLPEDVDTTAPVAVLEEVDADIEQSEVSLKILLSRLKPIQSTENNIVCNTVHNSPNETIESKPQLKFKIPEIPLEKFKGEILKFEQFKQQFMSIIGQNKDLTEVQKLYYLKASLVGEVKLLETCQDTYASLWETLETRFSNKRAVVDAHINNILNYPKVGEIPSQLRLFIDTIKGNLRALELLEMERNTFTDTLMLNVLLTKISSHLRREYELTLTTNTLPDFDDFLKFIENRTRVLDCLNKTNFVPSKDNTTASTYKQNATPISHYRAKTFLVNNQKKKQICSMKSCNDSQPHPLFRCNQFRNLSVQERTNHVKNSKICFRCLSYSHSDPTKCLSTKSCRWCQNINHNSMLCGQNNFIGAPTQSSDRLNSGKPKPLPVSDVTAAKATASESRADDIAFPACSPARSSFQRENTSGNPSNVALFSERKETDIKTILLNTAIVYLRGADNKRYPCRAIIDSGSMNSYATIKVANLLKLKKERVNLPISTLNDNTLYVKSQITTELSNKNNACSWNINLYIIPKITNFTPSVYINCTNLNIPNNIELADSHFNVPSTVDVLLSTEHFFEYLREGKIHLNNSNLRLQNSCFGFLVAGSLTQPPSSSQHSFNNTCFLTANHTTLNQTLESFWKVEEVNNDDVAPSDELIYCNKHFSNTHKRLPSGRYMVSLPFKPGRETEGSLGDSYKLATKRLNQLWVRLERNPEIKQLYTQFIDEYKLLNHMVEITDDVNINEGYYLCHHHVLKDSSLTTKLRVVFNASARTSNGSSLNDILLKGAIIQDDLYDIILRFRKHLFAFTADLRMMFRQVLVAPEQTKYQKILWKRSIDAPIQTFALSTVTYGMTPSSYLSTKTLQQLALDEQHNYPLASKVVLQDFYMDDCLSGTSSVQEFHQLKHQLIKIFASAGMQLHKFSSNINIEPNACSSYQISQINYSAISNTLGMSWHPDSDTFSYKVTITSSEKTTKRDVLSQISRLFDPLGLVQPCIVQTKILMQSLWLLKIGWHEELPNTVSQQWSTLLKTLPAIEAIHIPRCVLPSGASRVLLSGFSDSSEKAYGAAIYLQSTSDNVAFTSQLLTSKSRVAPLKKLTIPRLELQACLLLAKLTAKVAKALKLEISEIRFFTDSTICLFWINSSPHPLQSFVANRVTNIQQLTNPQQWFHVSSEQNPADCLSRGMNAETLVNHHLWWEGPPFLKENFIPPSNSFKKLSKSDSVYAELKDKTAVTLITNKAPNIIDTIIERTNNYTKLINILVFLRRFCYNSRHPNCKRSGPPSSSEIREALNFVVLHVQMKCFAQEKSDLCKGNPVASKSKLKHFFPFLDDFNIIRVGGRISNANIHTNQKFPIVLPAEHKFTKILFNHYHLRDLHPGPQALLSAIRQHFWPLSGRSIARKTVHSCIKCFRAKPVVVEQLMAQLPPARVRPSPPFSHTGVDLCGPFLIKFKNQRKGIFQKVYIAIFICLVTKAVHFEAVSDLSAETFIAALKRFFARRGRSKIMYSDNATNFSGSNTELKRLLEIVKNQDHAVTKFLSLEGLKWKFLPPRAPNQGGLWEAGIKSFKYHLKRTIGLSKLTLEEFLTIATQIEGILNSRPLTPLSADVNDFEVLTPSHFLIGQPINSIPEPDLLDIKENLLNRWQRVQKAVQNVWKCWSHNYLNHLQQRGKWQFKKENIKPGMVVLLKDDQLPVNQWSIGRIYDTFPGKDGNVRVINIRTPKGIVKRSVTKICLLPIEDNINFDARTE